MALSPLKALFFSLTWAFWVAAWGEAEQDVEEVPECSGWDLFLGCDETVDRIFEIVGVGTVPGAPVLVNIPFGILGVLSRLTVLWSLLELFRGT